MSESTTSSDSEQRPGVDKGAFFSLLGKAHTLEILQKAIFDGEQPIRFGKFQDELDLSPNTLSRRLEELVEVGFLDRTQYDEIPPRVEYEATEQLAALEPMFRELASWIERYGMEGTDCIDE